jgi:hypothetical protein
VSRFCVLVRRRNVAASIKKYKESLLATVKDALEILGYDPECIFNNNIGITGGDYKGNKQ